MCFKIVYSMEYFFNVPRDAHRYLIESISQCLHVKTMLASRCVSFYETIEQCLHVKTMLASRCVSFYETIEASSKLCIRFFSNVCKNDLNTVLGRNLFSIAIDCS